MTRLIIRKHQQQAQYYTEKVGTDFNLDMMLIPGGTFLMGTPDEEIEKLCQEYNTDVFRRESPQHSVTLPPFFMGKYPITQKQWKAIASLDKIDIDLNPAPSYFEGEDLPVERVNWYEAVEFCKRLSRETQREYRLPSEAEWEYACRGGTTTPFHFGETITTDLGNYRGTDWEIDKRVDPGNYGKGSKGEYREKTTPVGYFQVANAFGLYDMHGNVWEWCEDDYHPNYEGAPKDGSAWLGNSEGNTKILRGGSWFNNPVVCRCAYRHDNIPRDDFDDVVGFRVVGFSPRTL